MDERIEAIERKRRALYGTFKKERKNGILAAVLAILIFVISYFIGGQSLEPISALVGAIPVIFAIIFFVRAAKQAEAFKKLIKSEFIVEMLKEQFEDVTYDHEQSIPVDRINATKMIKKPDRFSGEDYISGTYKGVAFEVSDVTLKERVERRDSRGNTHVSYETYFQGRWYIYRFPRAFEGTIKIAEGHGFQMNHRGLEKIETESIAFNKKFAIYASDTQYAFYHLTPVIMEKFLELERMHRGKILYYFHDNELHIGINDRKDYLEVPISRTLDDQAINDFRSDIEIIPAIINEVRLDSDKFNRKPKRS
ncbi:MAG: DUF3137 domain-containing protein [Acholeplasmataceae bacterium]